MATKATRSILKRIRAQNQPDFTVSLELPDGCEIAESHGIAGIAVDGGRITCTGKSKDWVLCQVRMFLKRAGAIRQSGLLHKQSGPLDRGYRREIRIEVSPSPGHYIEKNEQGITSLRTLPLFPPENF